MAKWRALEEYTPFARTLVGYMWEQRPPLLPNQFAERMGVRKQALSTWLNSDAVPAPPVVVRLARGMGRPVRELVTAAGYAPADDPLLDIADAWAYVRSEVERALGAEGTAAGETGETGERGDGADTNGLVSAPSMARPESRETLLMLLQQLQQLQHVQDDTLATVATAKAKESLPDGASFAPSIAPSPVDSTDA